MPLVGMNFSESTKTPFRVLSITGIVIRLVMSLTKQGNLSSHIQGFSLSIHQ